jgi:hypothetical protein
MGYWEEDNEGGKGTQPGCEPLEKAIELAKPNDYGE